jgi:hypothetical protein
MADDAATRVRRSRKHCGGDHSLCVEGRCQAITAVTQPGERDELGAIEETVVDLAEALVLQRGDPRLTIVATSRRLAQALDTAPMSQLASLGRELRGQMTWLAEAHAQGDRVDEIRARRAARRLKLLLGDDQTG